MATFLLGAVIAAYGYAQWKAVAKVSGAWRLTGLVPLGFVVTTLGFVVAIGPRTAADWWWAALLVGLVCGVALVYLAFHWMLRRFVHGRDGMALATSREEVR